MTDKAALYDVVRRPILTAKSYLVGENNTYIFEVAMDANKPLIKEAVEAVFDVNVVSVNTAIAKGKVKRFKGRVGRRSDVKKAYVRLAEGQSIDVTTGL